jgi:Ca-activated chloride channel family protein
VQQRFALANTYYRLHRYKEAITLYKSIRSTSPRIKQKLYYNIANAYVMLKTYDKAKIYYTKALQLGDDTDAEANLALVAQLQSRQASNLGIAHPQSQSSQNSHSKTASAKEEKAKRQEDQPSSGSGAGGQMRQKSTRKEHKKLRLEYENDTAPQPLSSKVYELINKGYIREEQPW